MKDQFAKWTDSLYVTYLETDLDLPCGDISPFDNGLK